MIIHNLDIRKFWNEFPIVVIDFETTGIDYRTNEAIEVSIVKFEDGKQVSDFSSLLDPGIPIQEESRKIHKITDEELIGKPRLIDLRDKLLSLSKDCVPCAYNAPFDRAFLHKHIFDKSCALFDPEFPWIDPLVLIKEVDKHASGQGRYKLRSVCERWEIDAGMEYHRALNDSISCGLLLFEMLKRESIKSCSLGGFLDYIEKTRKKQDAEFQEYLKSK